MPRFRNAVTGSVVSVGDDTAAELGREWEPEKAPAKKAAAKKAASSDKK